MNNSTIYERFDGYNAYPAGAGEEMIRSRLSGLFSRLIERNHGCLEKAKEMGLEEIMSRILQVKSRLDRMKHEMDHRVIGGEYKLEKVSPADEGELSEIDFSLEKFMNDAYETMDISTCLGTDMHINEKFSIVSSCLREIEQLCHRRAEIFKKMRVHG